MSSEPIPEMPYGISFNTYWLAETLRLREAHWGPLEDASEVRRARAEGHGFPEKILLRALFLGQREKLVLAIEKWSQGAKLALIGMLAAALLAGAGAAAGALGDGARPVNLMLALVAMLGLHCLTFVFWLLSFALRGDNGGALLGQLWLWLTKKLARGPDAALAPRALAGLLGRNGALRWVLSAISHGLWAGAFLSLLMTLLAILSARRYSFNWETTLLPVDAFVHFTSLIGWLPSKMGFPIPGETIVRLSDGLHTLPESAQALWSGWLIGCVVVYGLLPRLVSFALSLTLARKHLRRISIDQNLPGYAQLRERLQPVSEKMGVDAPATDGFQSYIAPHVFASYGPHQALLVGVELAPDTAWPPAPAGSLIHDLGIIDSRAQRRALLDRLQQQPPERLLVACDGGQTPDRGIVAFVTDLASIAHQTHVVLIHPRPSAGDRNARVELWRAGLLAGGFMPDQIHCSFEPALAWLQQKHSVESGHTDGEPHGLV